MKIKGLDNGYLYTKDNEKRIFKSCFTKDITETNSKTIITIDGIQYCVGSGRTTVDINKVESDTNKVCTLMNLALTGNDSYYLVVGLPVGQFKTQKDALRNEILTYNKSEVLYKDRPFKFTIEDVCVFPQGVASLINENNLTDGDFILVDIGGLTIDVAYVEFTNGNPTLHKYNTWFDGMQKLYSDIIAAVNNKYNMTLSNDYAEKIFLNGLKVDGEKQDISFLDDIKEEFLLSTIKELNLGYPIRTTPIYVTGGGGKILYSTITNHFKSTLLLQDPQFSNAMGYHKIGLIKYKKYITMPLSSVNKIIS